LKIPIKKIWRGADAKNILINISNYGIFQIINYLVPLITVPYIVRIIGIEKFGILSISQAVVYYLKVITEYGFTISGVQLIALNQNNSETKSVIVTNFIVLEFILASGCFVLLWGISSFIPNFSTYKNIFFYTFSYIPGNILIAYWFYLGMERVKYINYITMTSKIIYIGLIFFLLKSESEFYLVPIFNGLSYMTAGLLSAFFMIFKFKIKVSSIKLSSLIQSLRNDFPLFISNLFINLYRNTNTLILGLVVSESAAGLYSAAEKLITAIQSVFAPITQAVFPYVSRLKGTDHKKSIRAVLILVKTMAILGFIISSVIIVGSDWLTPLILGDKFIKAALLVKIMAFVIMLGVINYIVGIIFMTNYNLKKEFSKSVILSGIFSLVFSSVFSYYWGELGAAFSFVLSEFNLLAIMMLYLLKNKAHWEVGYAI
jgi:PST family polysaccharide transporter